MFDELLALRLSQLDVLNDQLLGDDVRCDLVGHVCQRILEDPLKQVLGLPQSRALPSHHIWLFIEH